MYKHILFIALVAICSIQNTLAQKEVPFIIAHRGASGEAPENTIASANLAWEYNADAVEIDIHLTKDNKVVVHHDANTKRICGENYEIKNTDSKLLRKLDAGMHKGKQYEGEKMPFLSEIINTVPDRKSLVVEIKSGIDVVDQMAEVIKESGKKDQVIFISFDFEAITKAKKLFPNNKCFYLLHKLPKDYASILEKLKSNKLNGIDVNYRLVDSRLMSMASKYELEVHVYTVNDTEVAKELVTQGVKSITTDYPDKMREAIQ